MSTVNIKTAEDLVLMHVYPDGDFFLEQDVDLKGAQWSPVNNFTGSFDGKGYTIHNITISSEGNNLGFFARVEAEGRVEALQLENVTVAASADTCHMGLIAGVIAGSVKNCCVTGTLQGANNAIAGALAGRLLEGAVLVPGNVFSHTDPQGHTTEGLCAITKGVRKLVGQLPEGTVPEGLWLDCSTRTEDLPDYMQLRRAKVVNYMYEMATVQWIPTKTLVYMPKVSFKPTSISFQIYLEGKTYTGIPYNHSHGSLQRFMACLDEENKVKDWVNMLGPTSIDDRRKEPFETSGFAQMIGNDCSGAIYWAWLQISPGEVADVPWGRGVRVNLCQHIVPNPEQIRTSGVYPVGEYETVIPEGPEMNITEDIIALNGEKKMFEAYALAYRGDAVLAHNRHLNGFGSSGHVRMLTEDPIVIRRGDGSIDPNLSYLLTIEQGDGQMDSRVYTEKYTWRVNKQHTFRMLIDGAQNCANEAYVPVTVRALWDETVAEPFVKILRPETGELYSNYRIVSTTLTIRNAQDQVVYEKEVFTGVDGNGDNITERPEARDGNSFSQIVYLRAAHKNALDSISQDEEYHYNLSVQVSNGVVLRQDKSGVPFSGILVKQ